MHEWYNVTNFIGVSHFWWWQCVIFVYIICNYYINYFPIICSLMRQCLQWTTFQTIPHRGWTKVWPFDTREDIWTFETCTRVKTAWNPSAHLPHENVRLSSWMAGRSKDITFWDNNVWFYSKLVITRTTKIKLLILKYKNY